MEKAEPTIKIIRQKRTVPEQVNENRKRYNLFRKAIRDALKGRELTIPQIAAAIKMPVYDTTFYLMTMIRYGEVVAENLDDMDEYYFYKLK